MTVVSDGERLRAENETLRARLSSLTDAILRTSEDLDLDTVLQEVTDGARSLTEARYTARTTYDESGDMRDLLISGLGAEQTEQMLEYSMGPAVLAYLRELREPLRTGDFVAHAAAAGFPGRVVTHDQLLNSVWSEDRPADQRLLRSFVKNVRHKLGDDARNPSYIFTQSGVGYRLSKP